MVRDRRFGTSLREDLTRHGARLSHPGFVALVAYRFGVWRDRLPGGPARKLLRLPYVVMHRRVRNRHRIELHYTATVGRRVRLSGRGDVVIGNRVVIGDDCSIGQGVTIGKTRDESTGWPVIGDRVTIGPGAVIAGDIHVGDDAVVGPNSVVLADIPPAARVSARPAVAAEDLAAQTSRPTGSAPRSKSFEPVRTPWRRASRWLILRTRRISVAPSAELGTRLRMHMHGNIGIGRDVRLGRDVTIGYGVTIGWHEPTPGSPAPVTVVGDGVAFGAGSVVMAGVTISDSASVGPNTMVDADVPAGAILRSPPAAVLRPLRPVTS